MITTRFVNENITQLKKLIFITKDRALKAYYQGQLYAFELILSELNRNPDIQEDNDPLLEILNTSVSVPEENPDNRGYVEMNVSSTGTVTFTPTDDPAKAATVKDLKKVFKTQGR